ncbi:non-canonical purine NTP diphosphatase [Salegentibacter sp. F188]|uniref:dITP/XTP pyrophosphatase n=1 Tax=Autumnicola patrickiae TaxID=3075591 RepID=A0ABU3E1M4_9FLAO|nr:non-canonical purine NTP diphosphatase [Salegentibacter sp. F188]MDT0689872.1 non-canonical purine NTP diphosphatase [Salegentibacter sp. F188]
MKLVFATHNQNKLKEIKALLPESIELLSLNDINCVEDIPETADTIEGNALLKAEYVKENYGYDCFADDTGIEVEALEGKPGVFSARYAGEEKNDEANIQKLLTNLKEKKNRRAQFKTVIALCLEDNKDIFTGICKGRVLEEKRGTNGFGYDPVFKPEGEELSFAEMAMGKKAAISHRGKAFKKLISFLKE